MMPSAASPQPPDGCHCGRRLESFKVLDEATRLYIARARRGLSAAAAQIDALHDELEGAAQATRQGLADVRASTDSTRLRLAERLRMLEAHEERVTRAGFQALGMAPELN